MRGAPQRFRVTPVQIHLQQDQYVDADLDAAAHPELQRSLPDLEVQRLKHIAARPKENHHYTKQTNKNISYTVNNKQVICEHIPT